MAEIKIYSCAVCQRRGEKFESTRKRVRKHLREIHGVKGLSMRDNKKKDYSLVSEETLSREFK